MKSSNIFIKREVLPCITGIMRFIQFPMLSVFLLLVTVSPAQVTFHKEYGSNTPQLIRTVAETADGGLMFAGTYKTGGSGTWIIFIHKSDIDGNIIWSKAMQGNADQSIFDMEKTLDGHFIATGRATSFSAGEHDVFLTKFNEEGEILWSRMYGGTGQDWLNTRVLATADSGFVISASTTSYGAGDIDCYLIKTDAQGDTLWTRTIGGTSFDYSSQVIELDNGDLVMSGYTASYGPENYNYLLAKMNSSGDTLWTKIHGFDGSVSQFLYGVAEAENGDLMAVGKGSQAAVMRTDSEGNLIWHREFGGVLSFTDIIPLADGHFMVSGSGSGSIYNMKIDGLGNVLWSRRLGNDDFQTLTRNYPLQDGRHLLMTRKNQWPDDNTVLMMVDSASMMPCDVIDVNFSQTDIPLISTAGLELGSGAIINEAPFNVFDYDWVKTVYCTTECLIEGEISGTDLLCYEDSSGWAEIAIDQAYGSPEYAWSNGDSTSISMGLAAGWHYVEVIDSLGCDIQDSIFLEQPEPISISGTVEPQTDSEFGSITIQVEGGVPPYLPSWNNGMTGSFITELEADTFIVTVTDENMCVSMAEFIVPDSTGTISVGELAEMHIEFFPNPVSETLYIQLDQAYARVSLRVLDSNGKTAESLLFNNSRQIALSMAGHATGIYFLELLIKDRRYSIGPVHVK